MQIPENTDKGDLMEIAQGLTKIFANYPIETISEAVFSLFMTMMMRMELSKEEVLQLVSKNYEFFFSTTEKFKKEYRSKNI